LDRSGGPRLLETIVIADIFSYFHPWHWWIVAAFVVVWLLGGSWLFNRGLAQIGQVGNARSRRPKPQRGFGICLATILSGLAAGALVAYLFHRLSVRYEDITFVFIGLGLAFVVALVVAQMMAYVVLGLTARQTLRVSWKPIVAIYVIGAAMVAATAPMAISQTMVEEAKEKCQSNMTSISHVLSLHYNMASDLDSLVKNKQVTGSQILSPVSKSKYFYMPAKRLKDTVSVLVVCEQAGNHPGGRHAVVMDNDILSARWFSETEFKEWLKLPVNETFAKALAKAESK
jgi:hypothetical protein